MKEVVVPALLLLALAGWAGAAGSDVPEREVLARIGDREITRHDLDERLDRLPPEVQVRYAGQEGRRDFLREVLRIQVFAAEARAHGLDRQDDVRVKIEDIVNTLLAHEYVQRNVRSPGLVSEEVVVDFYRRHADELTEPEMILAPSIYLRVPANADERAVRHIRELGDDLAERIRAGESFETLEAKYSQDRTLGNDDLFPRGRLTPDIEGQVFALDAGEVSSALRVDGGYRIFYVREKVPARRLTLEEARDRIVYELAAADEQERYEILERQAFARYGVELAAAAGDEEERTVAGEILEVHEPNRPTLLRGSLLLRLDTPKNGEPVADERLVVQVPVSARLTAGQPGSESTIEFGELAPTQRIEVVLVGPTTSSSPPTGKAESIRLVRDQP